jgi:hypothetical protein
MLLSLSPSLHAIALTSYAAGAQCRDELVFFRKYGRELEVLTKTGKTHEILPVVELIYG